MRPTLEEYALRLAETASTRSEDPKRQVGACILGHDGRVLALGYNGPPAGIDLTPGEWANRDTARAMAIHAEVNALRFVKPGDGRLLASTYGPCAECVKAAAAQGIIRIVYQVESPDSGQAMLVADRFGLRYEALPDGRRTPTTASGLAMRASTSPCSDECTCGV